MSELSEEIDAVVTVTCSNCGSVRNAGNEVEEYNADVHGSSSKSDGSKDDLKKLIEVEVRKQIWPNSQSVDGKKISNADDVGKLSLPDVPDEEIVKKHTAAPAKATNSEIEERLKCLKYGDSVNDSMEVKAKDFDKIVQFKTT